LLAPPAYRAGEIHVARRPCAGLACPGYVPPSGFLTLLAACSLPSPAALFHAADAPGVPGPSELFPGNEAVAPLDARNPPAVSNRSARRLPGRPTSGSGTSSQSVTRQPELTGASGSLLSWACILSRAPLSRPALAAEAAGVLPWALPPRPGRRPQAGGGLGVMGALRSVARSGAGQPALTGGRPS
jgi:hypothetical protein